jgi:hypothetical protein
MAKPATLHDFAAEFWAKVRRPAGDPDRCWPRAGKPDRNGYCRFARQALSPPTRLAHRVAWELTYGPIPAGQQVLHTCDDRACCRPDHLFLGGPADRTANRRAKGRSAQGDRHGARTQPGRNFFVRNGGNGLKGEAHPNTKFSDAQVAEMRAAYAANPVRGTQAALVRKYGISASRVCQLVHERERKEVTMPKIGPTEA